MRSETTTTNQEARLRHRKLRSPGRTDLGWVLAAATALIAGCAGTPKAEMVKKLDEPAIAYAAEGKAIKADPVARLRELKKRCDGLEQYRLTFYRQERLGSLQPMETIQAAFRRDPFSVKFEWADEKMPYYESVYIAGQNDDKLLVRERHGLLFFPPTVRMLDVDFPAKIGKAKNPITAFGLAQISTRTLLPFDEPAVNAVMTIRYEGVVDLDPMHRPAHHLLIERPPMKGYQYTRQDFFIDAETGLPAGTDLWLPNGDLDARYRYADVRTDVQLTDADFRLSKGHPAE